MFFKIIGCMHACILHGSSARITRVPPFDKDSKWFSIGTVHIAAFCLMKTIPLAISSLLQISQLLFVRIHWSCGTKNVREVFKFAIFLQNSKHAAGKAATSRSTPVCHLCWILFKLFLIFELHCPPMGFPNPNITKSFYILHILAPLVGNNRVLKQKCSILGPGSGGVRLCNVFSN